MHPAHGQRRQMEGSEVPEMITRKGLPVVLAKATADVLPGRVIVFSVTRAKDIVGLRVYSVDGLEEKKKLRVVDEISISGREATEQKAMVTREREAILETKGRLVNADTDREKIP